MNQLEKTDDQQVMQTQTASILSVIASAASNPDVDIEKMKALLDMQERVLNKNAESAFNADFVDMQAEGLRVVRTKENKQTNSKYATLDNIQDALIPLAGKHGFAITFGEGEAPAEDWVRVTGDLIHRGGHVKSYFYDSPYDLAGIKGSVNKTKTHGKASAVSYGQRYLITMVFNASIIEDDDGNAANSHPRITADQATELRDLISETGSNLDKFCKHFKIDSIDELKAQAYSMAKGMLVSKK